MIDYPSPTISHRKHSSSFIYYLYPFVDYLHFAKDMAGEILVYNLPGQLLLRQTLESAVDGAEVSSLKNGQYILMAIGSDGQVYSVRFAVER